MMTRIAGFAITRTRVTMPQRSGTTASQESTTPDTGEVLAFEKRRGSDGDSIFLGGGTAPITVAVGGGTNDALVEAGIVQTYVHVIGTAGISLATTRERNGSSRSSRRPGAKRLGIRAARRARLRCRPGSRRYEHLGEERHHHDAHRYVRAATPRSH